MHNKLTLFVLSLALAFPFTGCGPSKEELAAKERQRLELEEKARREAEIGNKAITDMTNRAFRKRTPEEEAKFQEEKARQVRELIEAQKKADAAAAETKPSP